MSLLQGVLRNQTLLDSLDKKFDQTHLDSDYSDDELINVVSTTGWDHQEGFHPDR
jgi:hypothetical protein